MNDKKRKSKGSSASAGESSPMDVELLERIVKLMAAHDLNTVDVRDGRQRIVLKRGKAVPEVMHLGAPMAAMPAAAPAPAPASTPGPAPAAAAPAEDAGLITIKSPMVGTFYAAPAKGAKPFVTVGSAVDEETDVCIVEAMKVFNNIKAECRGTVAKVLAQDSQPVEFGQPLFLVKPS